MSGDARRSRRASLDRDGFDVLLASLDPQRERAGERYEAIRGRLLRFFACRGASHPDELTDETIDRVSRRLLQGESIRASDAGRYFLGVARNVLYEAWDRERSRPIMLELPPAIEAPATAWPGDSDDAALDCLEGCLQAFAPESRDLVLRYYEPDGGKKVEARRTLAAQLGVEVNALRLRLHRMRARLEGCVRGCLERRGETNVRGAPPSREGGGA